MAHLRFLLTCLVAVFLAFAPLAGCGLIDSLEPRTASPFSGKKVTSAELVAEAQKAEADRVAAASKIAAEQAAAAEKATLQVKAEDEEAQSTLEAQLATLDAQTTAARSQLLSDFRVAASKRASAMAIADADRRAQMAIFTSAQEAASKGIQAQVDAGLQSIEEQRKIASASWATLKNIPIVGQYVQASGADGLVTALISGGSVAGVAGVGNMLARSRRKAEDDKYDSDLEKERAASKAREDALYDEAYAKGQAAGLAIHTAHAVASGAATILKLAGGEIVPTAAAPAA